MVRAPRVSVASLVVLAAMAASPAGVPRLRADNVPAPVPVSKANHQLASQWTPGKTGKLVFDTAVTPHWLEFSDRFWYSFETTNGKRYFIVDPLKRTKGPLFDHTKMASMLTAILHLPVDAQHLGIKKITFTKKDTALLIEVEIPREAVVPGLKPLPAPEKTGDAKADAAKAEAAKTGVKTDDEKTQKEKVEGEGPAGEPASKVRSAYIEYDFATGKAVLLGDSDGPPKKMRWASVSPDDQTIVFARGANLFMMDAANYAKAQKTPGDATVVETPITTDGEEKFGYARRLQDEDRTALKKDSRGDKNKAGQRVPPIAIVWSKDSKKFAVVRRDERKVADLWVINALSNPRPTLEKYSYAMPGEAAIAQPVIEIFDVASKARVPANTALFKDQSIQILSAPQSEVDREKEKTEPRWLSDTPDKLYFTRVSRDLHKTDVCVLDVATGKVTVLVEERLNVYIETKPLALVGNGKELVHWSERDGWGHFYLYDGNGTLKNQITSGEFVCLEIVGLDEKTRTLFFTAVGREAGEDPYYPHLYRVQLDGTGLKMLTAGDASHLVNGNDAGKYFVDNSSRVDTPVKSTLIDAMGATVTELETTDMTGLLEAGFKFATPFKVKADDGITDIFGVMYKPFDFDPAKKYPIIAYVYPGPQTESVTKSFSPKNQNYGLAQFGFIVIEVGNRGGNPQRSKWYHSYGYGNLRDYGLADKKAAIEQLARKYSYVDIDRVGITGHSGGGFMSTAAMLVYPDFFKVAVSESGNHDNNVYNNTWSEKHHGIKEVDKGDETTFEYTIEKNSELAKNLKGHLLLATGDIDDNVHPTNTYRMANALIKANKRFDFFILPGVRHSFVPVADYFFWVKADYFCRFLLEDTSYQTVDIPELNREKEQNGRPR
jgi:dipeptidyl aminopeptidase/acylaminoacyl peptidase